MATPRKRGPRGDLTRAQTAALAAERASGPRYATPEDVEAQAAQWSAEVLACRDTGHHWQHEDVAHIARDRYYRVQDVCPRCGMSRYREMSERGHVYATSYAYPEGYLAKGLGRIAGEGKDMVRLASILREGPREVRRAADSGEPRFGATRREVGA